MREAYFATAVIMGRRSIQGAVLRRHLAPFVFPKRNWFCAVLGDVVNVGEADFLFKAESFFLERPTSLLEAMRQMMVSKSIEKESISFGSRLLGYCGDTLVTRQEFRDIRKQMEDISVGAIAKAARFDPKHGPTASIVDVKTGEVRSQVRSRGRGNFGYVSVDANLVVFCQIPPYSKDNRHCTVSVADATTGETLTTFSKDKMLTRELLEEEDDDDEDSVLGLLIIEYLACSGDKVAIAWGANCGGAVTLIDDARDSGCEPKAFEWDNLVFDLSFSTDGTLVLVRDPLALTLLDVAEKSIKKRIKLKNKRNYFTTPDDAAALSNDKTKIAATHEEGGAHILTVYAVDTGKPLFRVDPDDSPIHVIMGNCRILQVSFSQDDSLIAVSGPSFCTHNYRLPLYGASTGDQFNTISVHPSTDDTDDAVQCFQFAPPAAKDDDDTWILHTNGSWPRSKIEQSTTTSSPAAAESTEKKKKKKKNPRPCRYFFTAKGCRDGAACRFSHEGPPPPGRYFFSSRGCRDGADCRFSHHRSSSPSKTTTVVYDSLTLA